MNNFLKETHLLDYSSASIQNLVIQRQWQALDEISRVKAIYNFVRDEIKFGYNAADNIPASAVLRDGYGQCNTKATLLMALLRASGLPNRLHGFTIDKALQKGAIKGLWYALSPKQIVHSWVEVFIAGRWYFLEGVIIDKPYLKSLQKQFPHSTKSFCGYGVFTDNFTQPQIDWHLNHTFIQNKGINQDFGLFDTPDEFYDSHQQQLGAVKKFFFRNIVRHLMNHTVRKIRNNK